MSLSKFTRVSYHFGNVLTFAQAIMFPSFLKQQCFYHFCSILQACFKIRAGILFLHLVSIVTSAWLLPDVYIQTPVNISNCSETDRFKHTECKLFAADIGRLVAETVAIVCCSYAMINFIQECVYLKPRVRFAFTMLVSGWWRLSVT